MHSVISDPDWRGDETLDPRRSLLSERHPGTFAERVAVPRRNVLPKPRGLSFDEAACLPTAWLTAYRMLFTRSDAAPGSTVLVQGAGGGVSTAADRPRRRGRLPGLGDQPRRGEARPRAGARRRAGLRVRRPPPRARRRGHGDRRQGHLGALDQGPPPGRHARHLRRHLRPQPPGRLTRLFFLQLNVHGSTMGTLDELRRLIAFCDATGTKPLIDATFPLEEAPAALARLASGDVFGKLVLTR